MKFYRYEHFAFRDPYGFSIISDITEKIFHLVKETPCGWWIHEIAGYANMDDRWKEFWGKPKWVSKTARKRYAYPTREEALTSFIARKRRQIEIMETELEGARLALAMAEEKKSCST